MTARKTNRIGNSLETLERREVPAALQMGTSVPFVIDKAPIGELREFTKVRFNRHLAIKGDQDVRSMAANAKPLVLAPDGLGEPAPMETLTKGSGRELGRPANRPEAMAKPGFGEQFEKIELKLVRSTSGKK